jgi:prefoldin subunit 5
VLEGKLRREIEGIKKKDTEKQEKLFNETNARIAKVAKNSSEDTAALKANVTHLESIISKKVNPDELKTLTNMIKEVRNNYERESEATQDHIHKLEDKYAEFNRRFSVIESFTKNVKDKNTADLESKKSESHNEEYNAERSIKFKILDDRVKNLTANYENLKQELDKKADIVELVRMENTKVTKEELMSLLPSEESRDILKEEFKSEIAYFHKSIDDLARAWDLKLVKLRKEIDMHAIKREINKRALDDDVKHDLHVMDMKWSKFEQIITKFSLEFDGVKDFMKRFNKDIKELQDVNQNVLLGKQNIN